VSVLPANIQDRDGARPLLRKARRRFPFIKKIFADAGYQGPKMARTIAATGCWTIEIVKRSDAKGFVSYPSDGSSSARWPGSAETVASCATLNATQRPSPPSFVSP
jgi:transposase